MKNAPARVSIEIWSDVMCPWCVIGYNQLRGALDDLKGEIEAEIRWYPFELNPGMPEAGEDMAQHMLRKYGVPFDQAGSERMVRSAAQAGYDMRYQGEGEKPPQRIWNTFMAHKLLSWALEAQGAEAQTRLKLALFDAHFQQRRNMSDRDVLLGIAEREGFDRKACAEALDNEGLSEAVRAGEEQAYEMGITSVPLMLINRRVMIPGAQDRETYAGILRRTVERGLAGSAA